MPASHEMLSLISAKVAFTSSCNLACGYCEGTGGFKSKPAAMEDYRGTMLKGGETIGTDTLLAILEQLHLAGVQRMSPTGGDPLLRPDWDKVVTQSFRIGYQGVELTTNAILLESYLEREGKIPEGLTMVKVSLDTHDPERFTQITGGGKLDKVVRGIRAISPHVYTRANRVLLRSELDEIPQFVEFCQSLGMREASMLDLVYYPNRGNDGEQAFFEKEFVAYPEFARVLKKLYEVDMVPMVKWGVNFFQATLPGGFKITFKDSRVTQRGAPCKACPVSCQEGLCLIRVGTDGNITICPDYQAELSTHFNGPEAIKDRSFQPKMKEYAEIFAGSSSVETLAWFAKKHGVTLKYESPVKQ